ncbi:hypothetical protein BJY18_007062 [Amycolatopsis jiangsuensis]|uniref:Uncharacterized protein n=1 Tax=Amycolatopsis jiangsuensis TaxID=1181879 RepID=A0A840J879_9PSEU|nr:hypothetical protein [Amycolatopsis jiangsuensis]
MEEGVEVIVYAALLADDGTSGSFFNDSETVAW